MTDPAELARQTGIEEATLRAWREAGLFPDGVSDARRDVERARVLRTLSRSGVELEDLARSARDGVLARDLSRYLDAATSGGDGVEPIEALTGDPGCDRDDVERLCAAMGIGTEAGLLGHHDAAVIRSMLEARQAGLPEEALLQIVRVWAESGERAGEAAARLFHFYVHAAHERRARNDPGYDALSPTRATAERLEAFLEPGIVYFFRRGMVGARLAELVESVAAEAGVFEPAEVAGRMLAAVAFVDLSSFTALADAMGDERASEVLDRFGTAVRAAVRRSGGRAVKQIGDEFMLVFLEPTSAVHCVLEIRGRCRREPLFPATKTGVAWGAVLYRDGDYVGATVNLAARLASAADRHQVLVDGAVRTAMRLEHELSFLPHENGRIRGRAGDIEVFEVASPEGAEEPREVDVVCGMELRREEAAAHLALHGRDYYFCSEKCLRLFASDPEGRTREG